MVLGYLLIYSSPTTDYTADDGVRRHPRIGAGFKTLKMVSSIYDDSVQHKSTRAGVHISIPLGQTK